MQGHGKPAMPDQDRELTPEERLVATLIGVQHRIPGGLQIALGLNLVRSIEAVEQVFAEHNVPMRAELVAVLDMWRSHAEEGMQFLHQSDRLMSVALAAVGPTRKT